ncbi:MAG: hypothetical protein JWN62_418 [Acidimicrobiales bacterium]|nr:hypothetical protein [Acidimicrobiales bacterium]
MIWNFIGIFDAADPPDDVRWPLQPAGESSFRLLRGEQVVGSWG